MGVANPTARWSEAEYLELERKAESKSEFYKGDMFAMSGGSAAHSIISVNVGSELGNALEGSDYVVFSSNMRLKVQATGLITYADVTVAQANQEFESDEDDLLL